VRAEVVAVLEAEFRLAAAFGRNDDLHVLAGRADGLDRVAAVLLVDQQHRLTVIFLRGRQERFGDENLG
jgi:hypothetical protein